jgi:DNA ligase-1
MPSTPAKRSLDSFFSPASTSKRLADPSTSKGDITQSSKRNKQDTTNRGKGSNGKLDKGKGKAKQEEGGGQVETMMLSDSDEDQDRTTPTDDGDDDDIIIEEPQPSTSKPSVKPKKEKKLSPPPAHSHSPQIASIFKPKPPPHSTSSTKKPSNDDAVIKSEDTKPDLKPFNSSVSPTKMLSIFDTASASSSTSHPTASTSSSTTPSQPLDTPLFSFSPSPTFFSPHTRTPFSYLTSALVLLSSTRSRLLIQQVLTNLLRTVIELDPGTLESVVYLLSNRIGPSYEEGTELGVGWQVLSKAIKVSVFLESVCPYTIAERDRSSYLQETSGIGPQKLKSLGNKLGDPGERALDYIFLLFTGTDIVDFVATGDIAFEASKSVRLLLQPSPLMCHSIYSTLLQIAKLRGFVFPLSTSPLSEDMLS